ncbi:MAG: M15 family metallopeptidase [Chitinophagales bacterium]|nr:M15 family metallopeptidase [Chitinophagales bacterium]
MTVLKKGSKGKAVEELQKKLQLLGYNIEVDGDFGSRTERTVLDFQRSGFDADGNPLIADGKAGRKTIESIDKKLNEMQPVPRQSIKRDKITMERIELLHPSLRAETKAIYDELLQRKISVRFYSTLRTFKEQDELYAQGRTKPGNIVTNARAGQSFHNYGLALDFCLLLDGGKVASWNRKLDVNLNNIPEWDEIVWVFKHYGWEWGGDWASFKDYPHVQKTFGYTTAQLLNLHNSGKVKNGFVVIDVS